ncbi:helix-turn-helix transcriptional regulator [Candidatus Woesearchaeota archaeon]|nr:helix-turn-helix transcriptional regulator [Candidatus Pacearchaeota archaeon]MBS3119151.1 helix-turn-helix transcriptional regulator [Candidatus Woesearchaeota archaeon]
MAKNNFLLVNLNEEKTKKLTETITSDTSRKILNHLIENEEAEAKIAEALNLPISTAHYHLRKLVDAGLVMVEEFHYSKKGREINHYKLANKYIIIAPKKSSGLKQRLRGILPALGVLFGISILIKFIQSISQDLFGNISLKTSQAMTETVVKTASLTAKESYQFGAAEWFFIGGLAVIAIYVIIVSIDEKDYFKRN